jgi:hypothetical protein
MQQPRRNTADTSLLRRTHLAVQQNTIEHNTGHINHAKNHSLDLFNFVQ